MTEDSKFPLQSIKTPTIRFDTVNKLIEVNAHFSHYFKDIDKAMAGLRDCFNGDFLRRHKALTDAVKGWTDALQGAVKNSVAKEAIRQRGILPHKSTPWGLFDPGKPNEFADLVLNYYSNEWHQARAVFLADLDAYQIAEESKEAFIEGIECHTAKLYRPTILTVLPAAESEFRRTFEIAPGQPAASLEELRKTISAAPLGVFLSHVAPLDLFETLDGHLYEKVQSEEQVARLAADPIPNRHAAIHGLIQYKSELSSLNALIMTDYVFFLISQIASQLDSAD